MWVKLDVYYARLLPAPLWCRAGSTERGCRPAADGAALCADTHSQHQGCTLPQCVQTNCGNQNIRWKQISNQTSQACLRSSLWLQQTYLFYLCRIFSLTVCQRMFNTCKHVVKKLLWHLRCWASKNVWNDPSFLASLKFLALKFLAIHSPVELILPQTTFRKYTAV